MFAFAIGASSEVFIAETFLKTKLNNPFYRLNKIPGFRNIQTTVPKAFVFRSFVVLGNITEGLDSIIEGRSLINNGNVIVGNISLYSGFTLMLSPLILFSSFGFFGFLFLTVVLLIFKYIVPFFKDSDFKIFIETTVFYKQYAYRFNYLKYADVLEASGYIHHDLKALLQKDAKIKRSGVLANITTFRNQVDELLMTHLFTPSINDFQLSFGYEEASFHQKMGVTTIYNYPQSVSLSFSVNFALLMDQIETVQLEIFYSHSANPSREQLQPLVQRSGIGTDILYINGKPQTQESLANQWVLLDPAQDKIKYQQGILSYLYKLTDNQHGARKSAKELLTAPFFYKSPYYIFVYLRFKLKDKGWMPADRNGAEAYHISCFKIAAVPDHRKSKMYEPELLMVKNEIKNKPEYENLR